MRGLLYFGDAVLVFHPSHHLQGIYICKTVGFKVPSPALVFDTRVAHENLLRELFAGTFCIVAIWHMMSCCWSYMHLVLNICEANFGLLCGSRDPNMEEFAAYAEIVLWRIRKCSKDF